jgi:hypothetical protein
MHVRCSAVRCQYSVVPVLCHVVLRRAVLGSFVKVLWVAWGDMQGAHALGDAEHCMHGAQPVHLAAMVAMQNERLALPCRRYQCGSTLPVRQHATSAAARYQCSSTLPVQQHATSAAARYHCSSTLPLQQHATSAAARTPKSPLRPCCRFLRRRCFSSHPEISSIAISSTTISISPPLLLLCRPAVWYFR